MTNGKYFLVCFFCLALAVPLLGDLFGVPLFNTIDENRQLKTSSSVALKDRFSLYVKNFDSKFWGREVLLKAYIALKKDVFGISPLPEKIVMGKEEWLFLTDYGAMDDCRNVHPFSTEQIDSIQRYLTQVAEVLAEKSKKFYVIVVPDKHTIYPEFLPDNVRKIGPKSRLQQLTERLTKERNFVFINLTDTLLNSKSEGVLYYKQESHWNDLGSFIGYQRLMKSILIDFPKLRNVELTSCEVYQGVENDLDLAKILGESIKYYEPTQRIVPYNAGQIINGESGVSVPRAKRFNTNYALRKLNPAIAEPSVLVYRDSFFGSLIPFFEQSFAESTYVWTNDVDLEFAKQQSAQLVVLEIAERHIDLLTH